MIFKRGDKNERGRRGEPNQSTNKKTRGALSFLEESLTNSKQDRSRQIQLSYQQHIGERFQIQSSLKHPTQEGR